MIKKYNQFINESLNNTSTDSMELYELLKDLFNTKIGIDRPYDSLYETIDIRLKDETVKEELLNKIEEHNWYAAKNRYDYMEIKPYYSKGIVDVIPTKLYHATPFSKLEDILLNGLVPKSENIRHKYPPRIYLCKNPNTLDPLIKELKHWKGNEEYIKIEIDTTDLDLNLYKDIDCSYMGCYYIQNQIIPNKNINIYEDDKEI